MNGPPDSIDEIVYMPDQTEGLEPGATPGSATSAIAHVGTNDPALFRWMF